MRLDSSVRYPLFIHFRKCISFLHLRINYSQQRVTYIARVSHCSPTKMHSKPRDLAHVIRRARIGKNRNGALAHALRG